MEYVLSGRWSLSDPETGEGEDTAMGLPHPKHSASTAVKEATGVVMGAGICGGGVVGAAGVSSLAEWRCRGSRRAARWCSAGW